MPKSFAFLFPLALALSSAAEARTYRAGPFGFGAGSQIRCSLVNVSSKPLPAEIRMYGDGQAVIGSATSPEPIPAGGALSISLAPVSGIVRYCEFDVPSRKKIRMLACTQNANGDCIAVYPVD